MKMAGKIMLLQIFLFSIDASFSLEIITVSRIRIIIDDNIYVWEDRHSIPQKNPGGLTSPATVISFLDFKPGDSMPTGLLEYQVRLAEKRLNESHYFYEARVLIVPPREKPDRRTVIVRLQDGFLNRYGGGEAYVFLGFDNIDGENRSFRMYLGCNVDGVQYLDNGFEGSGLILGGSFFYSNSVLEFGSPADYQIYQLNLISGYRFLPDLVLNISIAGRYSEIKYHPGTCASPGNEYMVDFMAVPGIAYGLCAFMDPFEIDMNLYEEFNFIIPYSGTGDFHIFFSRNSLKLFAGDTGIFFQAAAGWTGDNLPFIDKFNLNDTPDLSVRGGWDYSDLIADRFVLLNTEFRFFLFKFFIPPFFNARVNGFLYADEGWTGFNQSGAGGTLYDGYGPGLRLLLDSPMFVYFSFSCGISRIGGFNFTFTGTAGF
jgi:hypothetical protein